MRKYIFQLETYEPERAARFLERVSKFFKSKERAVVIPDGIKIFELNTKTHEIKRL